MDVNVHLRIVHNPQSTTFLVTSIYNLDVPELTTKHSFQTIFHNDIVQSLIFDIVANPRPNISFFRDELQLEDANDSRLSITKTYLEEDEFITRVRANLTFLALDKTYSGFYNCNAANMVGSKSKRIHMIVHCEYYSICFDSKTKL